MKLCISVSIAVRTSAESPPSSAPKSALATISSVSCIMSAWTSRACPSAQDADQSLGEVDHELAEGRDPIAVERRLSELALGAPEVALAGEQTLAERELRLPEAIVLDELPVLVDEHLLDEVGMVGEQDALRAEPGRDQVAVLARPARQRPEPVGAELAQVAGKSSRRRTRRASRGGRSPADRRDFRDSSAPPGR